MYPLLIRDLFTDDYMIIALPLFQQLGRKYNRVFTMPDMRPWKKN